MGYFRDDTDDAAAATAIGAAAAGDPLIDAAGVRHRPAGEAVRIVSLVPSLTELLFTLGLGERVVGRTAYCVHPRPAVRAVPSVGGTKTVHLDRLRRLAPTHVVVNVDETPRALAEEIAGLGCVVVVTHPRSVDDTLELFRLFGALFDRETAAEALGRRLVAERDALRAAVGQRPQRPVLYLIWKEPWMTVARDTYIAALLAEARLVTLPASAAVRYPVIAFDEALLAAVDHVLFATEPFPFRQRHLDAFAEAFPGHRDKARLIDGQMLSWYGSRAIAAMGYLRRFVAALG